MSFPPATASNCLYCNQPSERPIGSEPDKNKAGKCPECGAPHHVWCWHSQGGCARPNCPCNPKTSRHKAIPYTPAQVHDLYMPGNSPEQANALPDRWAAFEKFQAEYATHSHRLIAAAWDDELFGHFQPAEQYRNEAAIAKQCVQTQDRLVSEYRRKHWQAVVNIYDADRAHLDDCIDFQSGLKQHVDEARKTLVAENKQRIMGAVEQNDDVQLERILSEHSIGYRPVVVLDHFERMQVLTPDERKRAALALERLAAIREIQRYLAHMDTQERALALYDEKLTTLHLADSKALTRQDRMGIYDARRGQTRDSLRQAVIRGDDSEVIAAAAAAMAAGWTLPDATLELVRQSAERQAARDRVAQADNESQLLIAYDDTLLSGDRGIDEEQRETIEATQRVYKPLLALRRAIRRNDQRTIASLISDPAQARELNAHLTQAEKGTVERVEESVGILQSLREQLAIQPRSEDVVRQIAALCAGSDTMPSLVLLMSPFEKDQVTKALATYTAIDELRRFEQAPDIVYTKLAIAKTYQQAREAGVVLPDTMNWSKIRAAVDFQERWSALTRAIESGNDRAIFEAWNPVHLNQALDLLSDKDKATLYRALQKTSRDERIQNALASNDAERVAFAKRELPDTFEP